MLGFARFIAATVAAMAVKSYVYALAVHNTVRAAGSPAGGEAVGVETILALLGVALVALLGHVVTRRYHGFAATPDGISN